ncbi:MAG: hypothetical protein P8Q89_05370 [Alphaproteobacteria bacterium]|nr:hypothetical protein [Alphaproteobacteria bacterium]
MTFDLFVGIDWSGARGEMHRGISVFAAERGDAPPRPVSPPGGAKRWSRLAVMDYLQHASETKQVLAGIDFAFAHPFHDTGSYYPNATGSPDNPRGLWQLIDEINLQQAYLYGGAIWDDAEFAPYYNAYGGRRGALFSSRRRRTEQDARAVKAPSPTFNCVGPAGVGTGSLAGMRMLHHLADTTHIWPFGDASCPTASLVLVEIFPSYYFAAAGIRPVNQQQAALPALNQALGFYGSAPLLDNSHLGGPDADDADALIAAAALRHHAADKACWQVPDEAALEGWIFGVKSGSQKP